MSEIKKSYYAIIPANVRYDKNIRPNAKLLYGEITALCNEKGYCWANNHYFSELYEVSKTSISLWIKELIDNGYITTELVYKEGSKEILHRYLRIINDPTQQKVKYPSPTKLKDNNTSFNTTTNTTRDKDTMSGKAEPPIPFKEIVSYLNEKAGTNYQHSGKKTRSLITARWNEGFKTDDFKKVVAIKTKEWLNDKDMSKFLRPETLFGTKFEGYLNQKEKSGGLRGYDTDEYDNFF